MPRPAAAISWSGGKDSCAAYHRARGEFNIVAAITMFNEDGTRSRSHGLRPEIVDAQWFLPDDLPELQFETSNALVTLARSAAAPQARPLDQHAPRPLRRSDAV